MWPAEPQSDIYSLFTSLLFNGCTSIYQEREDADLPILLPGICPIQGEPPGVFKNPIYGDRQLIKNSQMGPPH